MSVVLSILMLSFFFVIVCAFLVHANPWFFCRLLISIRWGDPIKKSWSVEIPLTDLARHICNGILMII
jgi:hypothetical protein